MNTKDFFKPVSSKQIKENLVKQFGSTVDLETYSREQLEDIRNKLRTKLSQQEGSAGINDLLTNETYQRDQAVLQLINTRIKEMLGEDIKKLKDKLDQLSENKKDRRAMKPTIKAKGSDGNLANNYPPFDKVTRGDVIAGATGKDQKGGKAKKEESVEEANWPGTPGGYEPGKDSKPQPSGGSGKKQGPRYGGSKQKDEPTKESKVKEAAKSCNRTAEGKMCPVHKMAECPMEEGMKMVQSPKGGMVPAFAADGRGKKDLKKTSKMDEANSIFRRHVKIVNESLGYLLQEDEEEKAKAITAASDMVNDFTSWMQRVGQYQTKVMIELSDEIRHNFGAAEAEAFKQAVGPALSATLETLTGQREAISAAVAALAGEQLPTTEPMGQEPPAADMPPEPDTEPAVEPAMPDEMNPPADEFGASDAAAGAGTPGREMRESKFARKLAESHSIMAKLAR